MGEGSLWAAGQTLAFVELETKFTFGAEVSAETVLAFQRTALCGEEEQRTPSQ